VFARPRPLQVTINDDDQQTLYIVIGTTAISVFIIGVSFYPVLLILHSPQVISIFQSWLSHLHYPRLYVNCVFMFVRHLPPAEDYGKRLITGCFSACLIIASLIVLMRIFFPLYYLFICIFYHNRRQFVKQHYSEIKKVNPKLPVLVRECKNVEPRIVARFGMYTDIYICHCVFVAVSALFTNDVRCLLFVCCPSSTIDYGTEKAVNVSGMEPAQIEQAVQKLVNGVAPAPKGPVIS
jgi:Mitochondrial ribosomal protein L51 / S25 / CI-B8 domain